MFKQKQIKISPRQGSFDTSGNKNIVDFSIPFGNYDLSSSSVIVNTLVSHTSTEPVHNSVSGDNSGVYNSKIDYNDSGDAGYNLLVCNRQDILVKNARMTSNKLGLIDSSINHNSFKTNLNALIRDSEELNEENSLGSISSSQDQGLVKHNHVAGVLVGVGDRASQPRNNEIVIPLKDVLPACVINNYQTGVHGDLDLHFEMRFNKLAPSDSIRLNSFYTSQYNANGDIANNALYGDMLDIPAQATGATVNLSEICTQIKYKDIQSSPFYNGKKLKFNHKVNNVAAAEEIIKIVSIRQVNLSSATDAATVAQTADDTAKNRLQGMLVLTLDGAAIAQTNTHTVSELKVVDLPATSNSLTINKVELKMMENMMPPPAPKQIAFDYISSHSDSYSQTQHQHQTYYIPPMTKCVYITFPESGIDKSFSKDAITHYRAIVENEPITESKIEVKSSKHYDLQAATFKNSNIYQLKNLGSYLRNSNFPTDSSTNQKKDITLICFPVPMKNEQQVLLLELEASSNMSGQIQLSFLRTKMIK